MLKVCMRQQSDRPNFSIRLVRKQRMLFDGIAKYRV